MSTRCQRRRRRISRSRSVSHDATSRTNRSVIRRRRGEVEAVMHNHQYSRGSPLAGVQRHLRARTGPDTPSAQEWREERAPNGGADGRGDGPRLLPSARSARGPDTRCGAPLLVRRGLGRQGQECSGERAQRAGWRGFDVTGALRGRCVAVVGPVTLGERSPLRVTASTLSGGPSRSPPPLPLRTAGGGAGVGLSVMGDPGAFILRMVGSPPTASCGW